MTLIISIVALIGILLLGGLAFFIDYKKGQKPTNFQKFIFFFFFLVLAFSIWDVINKDSAGRADKKEIKDTVTSKSQAVSLQVDSTGKIIAQRVDSAKRVIIDSMSKANDNLVSFLNKKIDDQAHVIDSLLRLHAERHLTDADKKDILARIKKLQIDNNINSNEVSIVKSQNSNGGTFLTELDDFLVSKGLQVSLMSAFGDTPLREYSVIIGPLGIPTVYVGSFDLQKTQP
jgi:cell division protein FtsI/penicillin-binding protein 2